MNNVTNSDTYFQMCLFHDRNENKMVLKGLQFSSSHINTDIEEKLIVANSDINNVIKKSFSDPSPETKVEISHLSEAATSHVCTAIKDELIIENQISGQLAEEVFFINL